MPPHTRYKRCSNRITTVLPGDTGILLPLAGRLIPASIAGRDVLANDILTIRIISIGQAITVIVQTVVAGRITERAFDSRSTRCAGITLGTAAAGFIAGRGTDTHTTTGRCAKCAVTVSVRAVDSLVTIIVETVEAGHLGRLGRHADIAVRIVQIGQTVAVIIQTVVAAYFPAGFVSRQW